MIKMEQGQVDVPISTLLELLNEDSSINDSLGLQKSALIYLNKLTPKFWSDASTNLPQIEVFHENCSDTEAYQLTSLLLSQIHFHLQNYGPALEYALRSKEQFRGCLNSIYNNVENTYSDTPSLKQFVDHTVALALDEYIRRHSSPQSQDFAELDELINVLLDLEDNTPLSQDYLKLLLGIALESNDLARTEAVLKRNWNTGGSFSLIRHIVVSHELLLNSKSFRMAVFDLLGRFAKEHFQPLLDLALVPVTEVESMTEPPLELPDIQFEELPTYAEILFNLDDHEGMAVLLRALTNASFKVPQSQPSVQNLNWLRAVQLAFDLVTFGSQNFTSRLRLHPLMNLEDGAPISKTESAQDQALDNGETTAKKEPPNASAAANGDESLNKDTDQSPQALLASRLSTLRKITTGDLQTGLFLKFSNQRNHTDLGILEVVKSGLDSRYAVLHTVLLATHGFLQRGTTSDTYLRQNLEWFSKSLCWSKFTATASLGVVHQTHSEKSFRVLSTYLPGIGGNNQSESSPYSDGGSLYALGLIHANLKDDRVVNYLVEQLSIGTGRVVATTANSVPSTVNEVAQYGASLGLGLAAMGTASDNLCEALKSVLMLDSATAGEAAALGLGLVMIGTGHSGTVNDLLSYARDTRHEKTIRACGLAIALIFYKCEEEAASMITQMVEDTNPLIRYGACFCLGLSYCGTSREEPLRHLLNIAVSDSDPDVRQAAVLSISYILCNNPSQAPRVFRLLTDSFNSRVRYAAILALGISCVGTANPDALALIAPATRDANDIVRQAAFIALGFVLMQCPEKYALESKKQHATQTSEEKTAAASQETKPMRIRNVTVPDFPTPSEAREVLIAVSKDSKEDVMARVGAIIGLGLLDAGGRNVTCSFLSHGGILRREAVVGFVLFSQYWYWYPLLLCLSLAMLPTTIIGVNGELRISETFALECGARPSYFDYPPPYEVKKQEKSMSPIQSLLAAAQRKKGITAPPPVVVASEPEPKIIPEPEPVEEESSHMIKNASRVLPMQLPLLKWSSSRYSPIFTKRKLRNGILVLVDNEPDADEMYIMS